MSKTTVEVVIKGESPVVQLVSFVLHCRVLFRRFCLDLQHEMTNVRTMSLCP